ncbi:hypothetical protein JVT61DRAFT_12334 [Boletus reticuloceps]|uniref:Myosin motor domain-containing protein n=1 Tax=Boletus reticuloceps TaxID=495285 RepID=A0A8I2YE48_9AGAM|nr:hypothetical protein JVT61DRAFT_12334 [Boletus reticuloceps]
MHSVIHSHLKMVSQTVASGNTTTDTATADGTLTDDDPGEFAIGFGRRQCPGKPLDQALRLSSHSKKELKVASQVKALHTLLGAFGNAKTVSNPNASCHGYYLELHFNDRGRIESAAVLPFALDKSRLSRLAHEECTFHIFTSLGRRGATGARLLQYQRVLSLDGLVGLLRPAHPTTLRYWLNNVTALAVLKNYLYDTLSGYNDVGRSSSFTEKNLNLQIVLLVGYVSVNSRYAHQQLLVPSLIKSAWTPDMTLNLAGHFEHQPHKYAASWTTGRIGPASKGGLLYVSSHGICVEPAANTMVVWQPLSVHGTSLQDRLIDQHDPHFSQTGLAIVTSNRLPSIWKQYRKDLLTHKEAAEDLEFDGSNEDDTVDGEGAGCCIGKECPICLHEASLSDSNE